MKGTLCALALSLAALTSGCNSPTALQPEGGNALEIPADCVNIKSIVRSDGPYWSLTCVDTNGKDAFYLHKYDSSDGWVKYDLVRK
ncbi:hypothetical protein GOV03_04720 [Candidatus Woesearchaeota archaeon]|nr:hypothetical protein [Candidatus Woesearchaeota archaeon]